MSVLRRVAFAFGQIPLQYGWAACVCLLTGAWALASRDRPVSATAVVLAGENILFASIYPTRGSEVYGCPAYLVGSLAVGVGVTDVMSELEGPAQRLMAVGSHIPGRVPAALAGLLVAVGLIGSGCLAVPVLTSSAAYALSEAFAWRWGLNVRPWRAKPFYAEIVVALWIGGLINFLGINPIDALVWSAVLNGVLAPPLLVLMMLVANNREVMGDRVNHGPDGPIRRS